MSNIRIVPCIAVIHRPDRDAPGRVLMLQRLHDSKFPDQWCIPGGKMEEGESTTDCAIRELLEETGLVADKFTLHYLRRVEGPLPNIRLDIFFIYYEGPRPPTVTIEDSFQGYGWFSIKDIGGLKNVMAPADRIADVVGGTL